MHGMGMQLALTGEENNFHMPLYLFGYVRWEAILTISELLSHLSNTSCIFKAFWQNFIWLLTWRLINPLACGQHKIKSMPPFLYQQYLFVLLNWARLVLLETNSSLLLQPVLFPTEQQDKPLFPWTIFKQLLGQVEGWGSSAVSPLNHWLMGSVVETVAGTSWCQCAWWRYFVL